MELKLAGITCTYDESTKRVVMGIKSLLKDRDMPETYENAVEALEYLTDSKAADLCTLQKTWAFLNLYVKPLYMFEN